MANLASLRLWQRSLRGENVKREVNVKPSLKDKTKTAAAAAVAGAAAAAAAAPPSKVAVVVKRRRSRLLSAPSQKLIQIDQAGQGG